MPLPGLHPPLQRQLQHAQTLPEPSRRRAHDRASPALPHLLLPHPRAPAPAPVLQLEQRLVLTPVLPAALRRRSFRWRGNSRLRSTRPRPIALDRASPHPRGRSPSRATPRVHSPGVPLRRRAPQLAPPCLRVSKSECRRPLHTLLAQPPVNAQRESASGASEAVAWGRDYTRRRLWNAESHARARGETVQEEDPEEENHCGRQYLISYPTVALYHSLC